MNATTRARQRPWPELHEDVEDLTAQGCSAAEICRRLQTTVPAVQRAYHRHSQPMPAPFRISALRKHG